jgi:hypothetical protein
MVTPHILAVDNLFDRALYYLRRGSTMEKGVEILIFGGFRGDSQYKNLGVNY